MDMGLRFLLFHLLNCEEGLAGFRMNSYELGGSMNSYEYKHGTAGTENAENAL